MKNLVRVCMCGSNSIDSIATSEGLMRFLEDSKLLPPNEIVRTNYRAYLIDANLEDYFNEEMSNWDNINHAILDLARKSYLLKR